MALSGSAPYYLSGGVGGGGGGSGGVGGATHTAFNSPTGFRNLSNPSSVHQVQPNYRGANSVAPAYNVEGPPAGFPPHGFSVSVASASAPGGGGGGGGVGVGVGGGGVGVGVGVGCALSGSETLKKKRGRPRQYAPDRSGVGAIAGSGPESVSLALSPSSTPNSNTSAEKRKRGRPPGSGRKQRLASVGEWMSTSAGIAFTPHVIYVSPGEDIASKILSFSQQRQRALCIMSASGGVSAVTLRQPASSVGNVTYEGRFEILCLSGSYLVAETGGARNRTGGINVSLSSPEGQIIGGSVAGRLIASRPTQVVLCSFVYGNPQKPPTTPKTKTESDAKGEKDSSEQHTSDNTAVTPVNASPSQHMTPPGNVRWPGSEVLDGKNPNTDIDLMRG